MRPKDNTGGLLPLAQLTERIQIWPSQVMVAVGEIASARGWKVIRKNFNEAEIRTRTSFLSRGERILVRVDGDRLSPAISNVTVASTSRFRMYEREKSKDNVSLVMNSIKQKSRTTSIQLPDRQGRPPNPGLRLGTGSDPEDIKFCAICGKKLQASASFCVVCGARQD